MREYVVSLLAVTLREDRREVTVAAEDGREAREKALALPCPPAPDGRTPDLVVCEGWREAGRN